MSRLEVIDTWIIITPIMAEQQERMEESREPRPSCCVQKRKELMYILVAETAAWTVYINPVMYVMSSKTVVYSLVFLTLGLS
jgi:hypothetical protein